MKRRDFLLGLGVVTGSAVSINNIDTISEPAMAFETAPTDLDETIEGLEGEVESLEIIFDDSDGVPGFRANVKNITNIDSDIDFEIKLIIEDNPQNIEDLTLTNGIINIPEPNFELDTNSLIQGIQATGNINNVEVPESGILELDIMQALDEENENTEVFNEPNNGSEKETACLFIMEFNHPDFKEQKIFESNFTITVRNIDPDGTTPIT